MVNPEALEAVRQEALEFMAKFRAVMIATCDRQAYPSASHAPYVAVDGDFYIYVSELVVRTQHLLETGRASLLFAEDERDSPNLFARRRLSLICEAVEVCLPSDLAGKVFACFRERFGSQFTPLLELADFHLFRLHPLSGLYVAGFGRAFALEDEGLTTIRHLTGHGHRRRERPLGI